MSLTQMELATMPSEPSNSQSQDGEPLQFHPLQFEPVETQPLKIDDTAEEPHFIETFTREIEPLDDDGTAPCDTQPLIHENAVSFIPDPLDYEPDVVNGDFEALTYEIEPHKVYENRNENNTLKDDNISYPDNEFEMAKDADDVNSDACRTQFAAVIFHNIPETYSVDVDIECSYSLSLDLSPSSRDWVGLYKVGWMSNREYVYYEWAPVPGVLTTSVSVTFPQKYLPGDNGEFYQFCYVTSAGQIRGASTPFQFRTPRAEDYVAVEDEDDDLMVIRPSKVVLEEKLQATEDDRQRVLTQYVALDKECTELRFQVTSLTKELQQERLTSKSTKMKYLKSEETVRILGDQLKRQSDEMGEELKALKQHNEMQHKKLCQAEEEIGTLVAEKKLLQSEKDEQSGRNQYLVEEKESYKTTLTMLEASSAGHLQNIDSLKKHIEVYRSELNDKQKEIDELKTSLSFDAEKIEQQQTASNEAHMRLTEMSEHLVQAENKIVVCESRKQLLHEEIEAYTETQLKMSRDLENSEMELFNLRDFIRQQTEELENLQMTLATVKSSNEELNKQVGDLIMEVSVIPKLTDEITMLKVAIEEQKTIEALLESSNEKRNELQHKVDAKTGSLYALQKSHDALKLRLVKSKSAYEEIKKQQTQLLTVQTLHVEREAELKREVEDMKERLTMCSDEYKALYHKYMKMEKKLEKTSKKNKSKSESDRPTDDFPYNNLQAVPSQIDESTTQEVPLTNEVKQNTASTENDCITEDNTDITSSTVTDETSEASNLETSSNTAYAVDGEVSGSEEGDEDENVISFTKQFVGGTGDVGVGSYPDTTKASVPYTPVPQDKGLSLEEAARLKKHNFDMQADYDEKIRCLENLLAHKDAVIHDMRRQISISKNEPPSTINIINYPHVSPNYTSDRLQPMLQYPYPQDETESITSVETRVAVLEQSPDEMGPIEQQSATAHVLPTAPVYPAQVSTERQSSVSSIDDHLSGEDCLLDPPLEPHVTTDAKVAAIKSVCYADRPTPVPRRTLDCEPLYVGLDDVILDEPFADRIFRDVPDEAPKVCPTCEEIFPMDISIIEFEQHLYTHYGHYCPICDAHMQASMTQREFEVHVQRHFDNSYPE